MSAGVHGSDFQLPHFVEPANTTAAVADLADIDDRNFDRVAGSILISLDGVVGGKLGAQVLDKAGFGGGAASVQGDDVLLENQLRQLGRANDARHRPGLYRFYGPLGRIMKGRNSASRQHHVKRAVHPEGSKIACEALEVSVHERHHVGIQHARARPLILSPLP